VTEVGKFKWSVLCNNQPAIAQATLQTNAAGAIVGVPVSTKQRQ
jgi:hypothetical protein